MDEIFLENYLLNVWLLKTEHTLTFQWWIQPIMVFVSLVIYLYIHLLHVKFLSIDFVIITGPMESFSAKSKRGQIPRVWHKACVCVNPDDVNQVVAQLTEWNLWRETAIYSHTFQWTQMRKNDSQPSIFWRRHWEQEKLKDQSQESCWYMTLVMFDHTSIFSLI